MYFLPLPIRKQFHEEKINHLISIFSLHFRIVHDVEKNTNTKIKLKLCCFLSSFLKIDTIREGKKNHETKKKKSPVWCVKENWFLKSIKLLLNFKSLNERTNERACNLLFCKCLVLWHKNLMNRRSINCLLTCLSFNYGSVVLSFCKRFTCSCLCLYKFIRYVWVRELLLDWIIWLQNSSLGQQVIATIGQSIDTYSFVIEWLIDLCVRHHYHRHCRRHRRHQCRFRTTQFKWKQKYNEIRMYVCDVACVNKVTEIAAITWVDSFFFFFLKLNFNFPVMMTRWFCPLDIIEFLRRRNECPILSTHKLIWQSYK